MNTAETIRQMLTELLDASTCPESETADIAEQYRFDFQRTFEEAGVMTMDEGLVIRDTDGNEFQITVVQSR